MLKIGMNKLNKESIEKSSLHSQTIHFDFIEKNPTHLNI